MPLGLDPHAEDALIGSMLNDPSCIPAVLRIIPANCDSWLRDNQNRIVFRAVVELHRDDKRTRPIDFVTLRSHLELSKKLDECGGELKLADLANSVPHSAHAEHYARIVAEHHRSLAVEKALRTATEELGGTDTAAEVVQRMSPKIESALSDGVVEVGEFHDVGAALQKQIMSGTRPTYRTGFRIYDEAAHLRPSMFAVIGARPKIGKTTFLTNIARNLVTDQEKGCGVLFITLEMPPEDLYYMVASQLQRVSRRLLEVAGIPPEEQAIHIHNAAEKVALNRLFLIQAWTDQEIIAAAATYQHKYGIGCVMVDYLQLVDCADRHNSWKDYDIVSRVTTNLARFSKKSNIAFMVASQLNRNPDSRPDNKPRLSDLRESGKIEQSATSVVFLHRPFVYDNTKPETTMELIMAANRYGKSHFTDEVYFDGTQGRIEHRNNTAEPPPPESDNGEMQWPDPY